MPMYVPVIAAVVVQLAAAGMALRLIRVTGRRVTWILFAVAMVLMAARRMLTLAHWWSLAEVHPREFQIEWIALAISVLLLAGLIGLAPLLKARRTSSDAMCGDESMALDLVQHAPFGIVYLDASGTVVFTNPASDRMMHVPPGQLSPAVGRNFLELPSIRRNADVHRMFERLLEGEPLPLVELDYESLLGVHLRLAVSGTPRLGADGKVTGAVVMHADATDRYVIEEALRASEARYRGVVEDQSELICRFRPHGALTFVNEACVRRLGVPREKLLGTSFYDRVPETERAAVRSQLQSLSPDSSVHTCEYHFLVTGGAGVWYQWTHRALVDEEGNVAELQAVGRDIASRKRAEAERARLSAAVEQAGEAIVITNAEGIIEYVNPSFARITGCTGAEAVGQPSRVRQGSEQDPSFSRQLQETLQRGEVWSGRIARRRPDGSTYQVEATVSPIRGEGGTITHYLEVLHDISDQVTLEDQLRQSQKMEAVGLLAGGVAHDFNNVLTAILGNIDLAKRGLHDAAQIEVALQDIEHCAHNAAKLTRQLLTFSRRQIIKPQVVSLNDVLGGMKGLLRRLIGEDVRLDTRLAPDLGQVRVDTGQVEQVILNLAVNARESMPAGGHLTITTRNTALDAAYVSVRPDVRPGPYIVLSVRDTGSGMNKDVLDRVFEPFFTTKPAGQGTGLGLSIVFGIVKQAGGHLAVYSELGHGTVFHVYLPRIDVEGKVEAAAPTAGNVPRGTETVLVAEDDDLVRRLTTRMLGECGYRVLVGEDGQSALRRAAEWPDRIHLLLTDVIMPDMDGVRLAEALRALRPEVRVLYVSGYTADVIIHRGISGDGAGFLEKPFTLDDLARSVREILDRTDGHAG